MNRARSGGRFFGHDHSGWPEEPVAEFVPLAQLLKHCALGNLGGFLLRNRLVPVGIEFFAVGVDFFQTCLRQNVFELLVNHIDARLKLLDRVACRAIGREQGHVKIIQHRDELLQKRFICVFADLLPFARRTFFEILKISRYSQHLLPVFAGFGGLLHQLRDFLSGQGRFVRGLGNGGQIFRRSVSFAVLPRLGRGHIILVDFHHHNCWSMIHMLGEMSNGRNGGVGQGRSLTRPGTLLRQQIPIRGSVWEEGKAGWMEVDTVALCGGSVAGEFVWMVDGVDYATTWVEMRAMWGRGQAGTLAALKDLEANLPFALLGLDSDNGGEFINHHVMSWLQKRERPVFMTRSRPYKKDDNAHVEQKNWTHVRGGFGYERYDNPELVEPINELVKGAYGQLLNFFHASLKLERKEREEGRIRRIYGEAQTPLARVLASDDVTRQTKQRLREEKSRLNPFALKLAVQCRLKAIDSMRRERK